MSDDVFFGKRGIAVKVFNGNMSGALTQLKRKVNAEGINRELRKREAFEPNTAKRRRKLAEAKIRWSKKRDQIQEIVKPKRKVKKRLQRQQKPADTATRDLPSRPGGSDSFASWPQLSPWHIASRPAACPDSLHFQVRNGENCHLGRRHSCGRAFLALQNLCAFRDCARSCWKKAEDCSTSQHIHPNQERHMSTLVGWEGGMEMGGKNLHK